MASFFPTCGSSRLINRMLEAFTILRKWNSFDGECPMEVSAWVRNLSSSWFFPRNNNSTIKVLMMLQREVITFKALIMEPAQWWQLWKTMVQMGDPDRKIRYDIEQRAAQEWNQLWEGVSGRYRSPDMRYSRNNSEIPNILETGPWSDKIKMEFNQWPCQS